MSAGAGKPTKVIVVGAGLAGLTAGFELMQSGHEVNVLEARMRPGGRVYTIRDPFADGLYAEAGAVDIGDGYTLLMRYINLFNLPLSPIPDTPKAVIYARGNRYVVASGHEPDWPYHLQPEERKLGRLGLWEKYVGPVCAQLADPFQTGWPDSSAREYDGGTFNEFLLKRGLSKEAVELFHFSLNGDDFDHISGLQSLLWESFLAHNTKWMTLCGGNDQLPKAFAARLGDRIHYGSAVTKVEQDERRVRVSFDRGGTQQQLEAEHAILAIPFSVLRQIDLDSTISSLKRNVIADLRYESIMRVYLQSKHRFWSEQGIAGNASTDLPISLVVDHTATQPGTRGILESQTERDTALQMKAMKPGDRVRWALKYMEQVHPGFTENFEGGTSFSWDDEPWSRGAWAYYAPGEMTTLFPHVAKPEGRVHFAGEHTSPLMTLEGAVQSGIRAAGEISAVH